MTPRYLTVDCFGRMYEVTNLFDRNANPTEDPVLASTCMIRFAEDRLVPADIIDVPIYTVH